MLQFTHVIAVVAAFLTLSACAGAANAPETADSFPLTGFHAAREPKSCPCLYVANASAKAGPNNPRGSITIYADGARGNAAPIRIIKGNKTGLDQPADVAVDDNGDIYVAQGGEGPYAVKVFAANANGNVASLRTIVGPDTKLDAPLGVAISPINGNIFVANSGLNASFPGSVTVYAPNANGNVAPIATIAGAHTGLNEPDGLTLDSVGNLYVANQSGCSPGYGSGSVTVYAPGATGDVTPLRAIMGGDTDLCNPAKIAIDPSGELHVADSEPLGAVSDYSAEADGDAVPLRWLIGKKTGMSAADGIAMDSNGNVFVANLTSEITVYGPGSGRQNVKPTFVIKGLTTGLSAPGGITIR